MRVELAAAAAAAAASHFHLFSAAHLNKLVTDPFTRPSHLQYAGKLKFIP